MPPSLSDADYARFRDLVRAKSGLEFAESRRPDLDRAVQRALADGLAPDVDSLYRLLAAGPRGQPALDAFIADLAIGETHFFRNRPQFEALERHILPDLIDRRRATRRLRLWSAGCSTGEEPYSLAMLLKRLLPDLERWNVLLLATDINQRALERARRAVYGPWSFRDVPSSIQETYFTRHGRDLALVPEIRAMVTFAHLNLVEGVYPSLLTNTHAMDLILCRNVTIYFDAETTRRVVARLYDSLAGGGWLVVGHAEPSQETYRRFVAHNFPGAVIYQKPVDDASQRSGDERSEMQAHKQALPLPSPVSPLPSPLSRLPSPVSPLPSSLSPHEEALALWRAGREDEALRRLEALAEASPQDAQAPYLAAKIAADRVRLDAAERYIALALQRAPLMARAHYLHGLILQEAGRLDEALAALRRSIYADPAFVLGHFALAGVFDRLGQPRRAQKALDNVADLLAGQPREALVPEGDGLTVGRLLDLVALQREG